MGFEDLEIRGDVGGECEGGGLWGRSGHHARTKTEANLKFGSAAASSKLYQHPVIRLNTLR
jgi:hypothetical protein